MGLFGFQPQQQRERVQAVQQAQRPRGIAEAMLGIVPTGRAAVQNLEAGATMQQSAIDRLMSIGTEKARSAAEMISDNPQAAQYMIEQEGGWDQFEQREQAQAAFGQATQMMAQGANPMQLFAALGQQGVAPGLAGGIAQQQQNLLPPGQKGADWEKVELFDADSPTQTSIYSRNRLTGEQVLIGAGKPASGTDIRVGPDGTIIRMGRGVGGSGDIEKKTRGRLEGELIEAGDKFARLNLMIDTFDEDMLTFGSRASAFGFQLAEKAGVNIGADNREFLTKYTDFQTATLKNINRTISEITGAAMSEPEAKRIQGELPLMTDSKTVFESKLETTRNVIQDVMDRRRHMLAFGLTDIGEMSIPQFKRSRDAELEKLKEAQDPRIPDQERAASAWEMYQARLEQR